MVFSCCLMQHKARLAYRMSMFILIWQDCFFSVMTRFETYGECSCGLTFNFVSFPKLLQMSTQFFLLCKRNGAVWSHVWWLRGVNVEINFFIFSKPIPNNMALCFSRRLLMHWYSSGETVSVCSVIVLSCIPAVQMLSAIPAMGTSLLFSLFGGKAWCPFLFMARIPRT